MILLAVVLELQSDVASSQGSFSRSALARDCLLRLALSPVATLSFRPFEFSGRFVGIRQGQIKLFTSLFNKCYLISGVRVNFLPNYSSMQSAPQKPAIIYGDFIQISHINRAK